MEQLFFFGFAAVALMTFGFLRWRAGVKLFFLLVIVDGAIRKWVFPEAQQGLYFLKDFLLVGTYLRVLLTGARLITPQVRPWATLNLLLAFIVTIQTFNPELPSLVLGLAGWKGYLIYVPMALILPYMFDSMEGLMRSLRYYAMIAVAVAFIGVVQFFAGPDNPLNIGLLDSTGMITDQAVFHQVERVRVPGPFTFVSGFTAYLTAMLACSLVLIVGSPNRFGISQWAMYAVCSACVLGMFMSGSRAPMLTGVALVVIFFFRSINLGFIRERQIWAVCTSVVVIIGAVLWVLPEALEAWSARTTALQVDEDPILRRVFSEFTELWRVTYEAGLLGWGTGATHNAAVTIMDVPGGLWSWLPTISEGEMSRVMIELGLVGWALVYGARILIIVVLWRETAKLSERSARALLAGICAFLIVLLPSQIVLNPVASAYYYGALGLAFATMRIAGRSTQQTVSELWHAESRIPRPQTR